MALKERAITPTTGLGAFSRLKLDLGDEEPYSHAVSASF
jgi:hypothetical protein